MSALEQVKEQNQALALQALQHSAGHKAGLHRSSYTSANSDQWHDAVSHTMSDTSAVTEAEQREIEQYLQELEMLRGPAPGPELACTPSCVPDPPLLFAPKHWKWCQVDARPFCAYWERDAVRSTPFPLPIDKQCGLSKLAMRCHESIPGMWVSVWAGVCLGSWAWQGVGFVILSFCGTGGLLTCMFTVYLFVLGVLGVLLVHSVRDHVPQQVP